jgi:two-component system chemotaxis response regulator CheY
MSNANHVILLVDPDEDARTSLSVDLQSRDTTILHARDGAAALAQMSKTSIAVLVSELYLGVGENECLVHAIRRDVTHQRTRIVVHTAHARAADREWAMRAGADAYLIKPTRSRRLRYVVARLRAARAANAATLPATMSRVTRRDSLDAALADIEEGALSGAAAIVFGRIWWNELSAAQRAGFRERAEQGRVSLRSDSMLGSHFVEVRGPSVHRRSPSSYQRAAP